MSIRRSGLYQHFDSTSFPMTSTATSMTTPSNISNLTVSASDESFDDDDDDYNFAADVHHGFYDDNLIKLFQQNKVDLRRYTSGLYFDRDDSIYHRLGRSVGAPVDDYAVPFMIFRLFTLNRRFIRDKIISYKCGDMFKTGAQLRQKKELMKQIEVYNIPPPKIKFKHPPPRIFPQLSHYFARRISLNIKAKLQSDSQLMSQEDDDKDDETEDEKSIEESGNIYISSRRRGPMEPKERTLQISCPRCFYSGVPTIDHENGNLSYGLMTALLVVGLFPLAWIPLTIAKLKDVCYVCPECFFNLGTLKRGFRKTTMEWNKSFDGRHLNR